MYKIIFLDDELITLRMLESAIDWSYYQVNICGTASDGEEGIDLFEQVEPDIVIADIRMPKLNGIEFARAIRQTRKQVKILLLSAYAEFEYAQSAISYQISDYLLKPLDEDKLEAAIARIVQELDRDATVSSTIESYRLERAEKQFQQWFMRAQDSTPEVVPDELRVAFGQADTLVHILRVTEAHEMQTHTDVESLRLFFKDRLGAPTAVVPISPVELIALTTQVEPERFVEMASALCLRSQPIKIGISAIPAPFKLMQAQQQAEAALHECFYSGESISLYDDAPSFSSEIAFHLADFEGLIAELVEQGKCGDLIASLRANLAELFSRWVNPALIENFVFDLLDWIKIALTKQYPSYLLNGLGTLERNRLRACATHDALVDYLTRHLQAIGIAVNTLLSEDPGYYIVRRAKDYAREHYTVVGFSLQDAADYVGLSKNHLSRVFHKTTGVKFWDYVTQLRIEKAKELLKQSNRSNSEICQAIGYESEFYFSKIFKRVVGVSAQQFRRL